MISSATAVILGICAFVVGAVGGYLVGWGRQVMPAVIQEVLDELRTREGLLEDWPTSDQVGEDMSDA